MTEEGERQDYYRAIDTKRRATQCMACSRAIILEQGRPNTEVTFLRCAAEPLGPSFLLCFECACRALAALDGMSYEQIVEDHQNLFRESPG